MDETQAELPPSRKRQLDDDEPRASTFVNHRLEDGFAALASDFGMTWQLYDAAAKPRVLIMVSRFGHCLNDLLYRHRIGDRAGTSLSRAPHERKAASPADQVRYVLFSVVPRDERRG